MVRVVSLHERAERVLRQYGAVVAKAGEETPGAVIRALLIEVERQQRVLEAAGAMLRSVRQHGAAPADVVTAVEAMLQNERRAAGCPQAVPVGQAAPLRAATGPGQG